jgi:hypothetical protein
MKDNEETYDGFELVDTTKISSTVGYHEEHGYLYMSYSNVRDCKKAKIYVKNKIYSTDLVNPWVGDKGCKYKKKKGKRYYTCKKTLRAGDTVTWAVPMHEGNTFKPKIKVKGKCCTCV